MNQSSHKLLLLFLLACSSGPASGQSDAANPATQPQAERPVWKVGYKWTYHHVSRPPAQESDWNREVIEALPNQRFSVRMENGNTLVFDDETNSLDSRGSEYSWKRLSFPLFVGKKWTHDRRIGNLENEGYETASWEVKAYEKVTVPAGTFDCFRVDGVIWQTQSNGIYTPRHGHNDVTYWYCPTVKWVARWKSRARASDFSPYIDHDSVLTSFVAD